MGKHELILELEKRGIQLNEAARALFAHSRFITSEAASVFQTVETTVADLGFANGATIAEVIQKARASGLSLCPLELGPHLRLQHLEQPEGHIGHPATQHRAPAGALTVVSPEVAEDEDTPTGFYLRRINSVLWLRGYCSGPDHIWSPDDHLIFAATSNAANPS